MRVSPSGGQGVSFGETSTIYTGAIQDLLAYIREGMRPRNPALKGAGDPQDGSPDIGAVQAKD